MLPAPGQSLSIPKAEGGLGFRDIQAFNQALLAKVAWRIVTEPSCLLARILTGKYCHKGAFLRIEPASSCSYGWRSIMHGRDLLVQNLADKIQCLRPSQEGVDDAFIWQPSTSGIYSTKSGYHSAMISVFNPTNARLPPGRSIDWYKDVWSGSCSPKLRVFLWSVL